MVHRYLAPASTLWSKSWMLPSGMSIDHVPPAAAGDPSPALVQAARTTHSHSARNFIRGFSHGGVVGRTCTCVRYRPKADTPSVENDKVHFSHHRPVAKKAQKDVAAAMALLHANDFTKLVAR